MGRRLGGRRAGGSPILAAVPIYEYRCDDGHNFDVMQKMADDALTECIECGAPVQKVLHAPSVHFKGSGFYNTDYGTAKRKRELDKSAADGSDKHDAKTKEKAGSKSDSSSSSSSNGSGSDSGSKAPAKTSSSSD